MKPALALLAVLLGGCLGEEAPVVAIGTTTSVQDSGLLDATLLPAFERDTGIRARAVVGGTGEILEKAKRGDVDVLLTHSPERERRLVEEGWAVSREPVMTNRFVLVGPADDTADVRSAPNASEALLRIREREATFASRGDKSGTHDKELSLWRDAELDPRSFDRAWYKETGSPQGQTLLFADERRAYTLVDEATLRQHHANGLARSLVVLHEGDPRLVNEYAVSRLDASALPPGVRADLGARFADWLVSPAGQASIAAYHVDGAPAFAPVREEAST